MTTRVLVADDERGMRDTLVDILQMAGYSVSAAADGAKALDMAAKQAFDVVVMDMRMPVLTGVEVLTRLGHPPPQVVLITAYALEDELSKARESEVFAVLQKPFAVPFLLQVVAEAAAAA